MSHSTIDVRSRAEISLVEHLGYRYRQHIGALDTKGDPPSAHESGFGALRLFDDATIDPASHVTVEAHDGFETVVYVLEGECVIEDDRGHATPLGRGGAACMGLGHGIRHEVSNPSPSAPLRVLVAAAAAPLSNPPPRLAVGPFGQETPGIGWVENHGAATHIEGSLPVGESVRLGIGTLDSGVELGFPRAVDRGLFVDVLEGNIELGSGFVDAGGDARVSLDAPVRLQAITRSRLVIADVAMGYVQQLV